MPRSVSRRYFAGGALTAAAAAAIGAETTEAPPPAEAQRQYQAILERYGSRFSDSEKADIRRLLALGVKGIEPLRAFPIENSNEPATIFRVWRADKA